MTAYENYRLDLGLLNKKMVLEAKQTETPRMSALVIDDRMSDVMSELVAALLKFLAAGALMSFFFGGVYISCRLEVYCQ